MTVEQLRPLACLARSTKAFGVRRSLTEFPNIIRRLQGILERFLDSLYCLESCVVADSTLEGLSSPSRVGKARVGGVDLNKLRMRLVLESVLSLSTSPRGFTASDLTTRAKDLGGTATYTPRQAAYDIRKLRAKRLVKKLGKSRRYQASPEGLRAIAALVILRDKVIKPLLAANLTTRRGRKPKNRTVLDQHYERVQNEMKELFQTLGITARPVDSSFYMASQ